MRLLIMACSATKRSDPLPLPSLDRYDGPAARLLRKAIRDLAGEDRPLVRILSAEFGLIRIDTPIPWYDRRMDALRAAALAPQVRQELHEVLTPTISEVFIHLGRDYLPALQPLPEGPWRVQYAQGGIGTRLGQLRRWLYEMP